nr:uncharacterized protein LOC103234738 [Chlorocebus sabaeus]
MRKGSLDTVNQNCCLRTCGVQVSYRSWGSVAAQLEPLTYVSLKACSKRKGSLKQRACLNKGPARPSGAAMSGLDPCLTFRPLSNKKKGAMCLSGCFLLLWVIVGFFRDRNLGIGVEQHLIDSDPGDFFYAVLDEAEDTGSYEQLLPLGVRHVKEEESNPEKFPDLHLLLRFNNHQEILMTLLSGAPLFPPGKKE